MDIIELLKAADPALGDVPTVDFDDALDSPVDLPTPPVGRSRRVVAAAAAGIMLLIGVGAVVARGQATGAPSSVWSDTLDGHSFTSVAITSSRPVAELPTTLTMAFDHGTLHVTTKPGCAVVAETFTVEGDRLVGTDVGVVVDHAVPVGETGCAANPITDWVIGMLQADPVITQVAAQRIEVSNQADRVTLHQNS